MQKKYREVFQFQKAAQIYLATGPSDDKFSYALRKMLRRVETYLEKYQEKIEDLRIDHCDADEKGHIQTDDKGNYKFSKEGMKKLNAAIRKLYETDTTIEPYEAKYPKEFESDLKEIFSGFITEKKGA